MKKEVEQLDLFTALQDKKVEENIYYNGEGEPLPWESPEYLANLYGN